MLLSAAVASAQLDDNTITITATRQIMPQPDQIAFSVSVQTTLSASIDGALAEVSGTGITAADLTEVFSGTGDTLDWIFRLSAPLSQAGATAALLARAAQQSKVITSIESLGTQVSQTAQASQTCSQSLVADAQKQAQTLASAAGFTVGTVLAVSDGSGIQNATPTTVPAVVAVLGAYSFATIPAAVSSTNTCTAVVKFQLYSYH